MIVFASARRVTAARVLLACALLSALTLSGCDGITNPVRQLLSPPAARQFVSPTGTVAVTSDSMRGWAFYDDQGGALCTTPTVCRFVDGPIGAPIGIGSAELATTQTTEGKALILADFKGVRFDHITTLKYWAYRQSVDAGNNLAIALQLNVDFDLTDAAVGYQGRLVFEPYQGNGGGVARNTWHEWDAKAGKWWGTRTTVSRGGVSVSNPCVQAHPCSWAQVLASFPNIGVHTTQGAVVLLPPSRWHPRDPRVTMGSTTITSGDTSHVATSFTPLPRPVGVRT